MSSSTPGRATRPSPAVYRRRRIVALLLLLLLVAAVVWGVLALLGRDADAAPEPPSPESSPAAAEEPSGAATEDAPADAEPTEAGQDPENGEEPAPSGEVLSCLAADMGTELVLDPASPAGGSGVRFEVTLRNEGEQPCLVDAGPAVLVASVGSGADPVWTSAHCAGEESNELLLDTGAETAVTLAWDGHRSAPGCPGDQPEAGAGTYRVALALDGQRLEPSAGRSFSIG